MQQGNGIARPGSVIWEEAYALGKVLEHGGWNGALVRGITPSDVDFCFDNAGMIIFGELSATCREWSQLQRGQRDFYTNCIRDRLNCSCAVLCHHNVRPEAGRKINTRTDIKSFQIMMWEAGPVFSQVIEGNGKWQAFVFDWVNTAYGPMRLLGHGRMVCAIHPDFIDREESAP